MRYVMIDGSPAGEASVTKDLIQRYLPNIRGEEYGILYARSEDHAQDVMILNAADAVILFSPVYNGGLPDQMLAFMAHLSGAGTVKALPAAVYLHTDLYDPSACEAAVEFVQDWCRTMKWNLKIIVSIGGDRLLAAARSSELSETFCARIDRAMAAHVDVFARGRQDNIWIRPPFPRFLYNQTAERNRRRKPK